MGMSTPKGGVSDWQPSTPTKTNQSLMAADAKDDPDTLTPPSPLKQAVGGQGKPKGPLGKAGREF